MYRNKIDSSSHLHQCRKLKALLWPPGVLEGELRGLLVSCRAETAARGSGQERYLRWRTFRAGGNRLVPAEPLPPLVVLRHQLPEAADVGGGSHGEVHEVRSGGGAEACQGRS